MSNALRNVAETTAHAWSDLVDEARELVDEARERIEDLPPCREPSDASPASSG